MNEEPEGSTTDIPPRRKTKKPKSRLGKAGQFVFSLFLGFFFFVGFPAGATAIAPVSWVTFERVAGQVNARAKTCLLFIIPYRTRTIEAVDRISTRFVAGEYSDDSSRRRTEQTKSEDQGYLVIHSQDQWVEIPISPVSMKSASHQAQDFLDQPDATELRLFVVANWKFSVIAGGLLSLLAVLYLTLLAFDLTLKLIHALQWAVGVPPQKRLLAAWVKKVNANRPK